MNKTILLFSIVSILAIQSLQAMETRKEFDSDAFSSEEGSYELEDFVYADLSHVIPKKLESDLSSKEQKLQSKVPDVQTVSTARQQKTGRTKEASKKPRKKVAKTLRAFLTKNNKKQTDDVTRPRSYTDANVPKDHQYKDNAVTPQELWRKIDRLQELQETRMQLRQKKDSTKGFTEITTVGKERAEIFKYLFNHKQHIDSPRDGVTPLHFALQKSNLGLFKKLIALGAYLDEKDVIFIEDMLKGGYGCNGDGKDELKELEVVCRFLDNQCGKLEKRLAELEEQRNGGVLAERVTTLEKRYETLDSMKKLFQEAYLRD